MDVLGLESVMDSFAWVFTIGADLNWEVELVLLIWRTSISSLYGVEDGEDWVAEIVSLKHTSVRMKS